MNFICVTIDNRREEGLETCMFFLADARHGHVIQLLLKSKHVVSAMASGMVRAAISFFVMESSKGSDCWKMANRLSTGVI